MLPIEGILPGSRIKAYIYFGSNQKPNSWTFTLGNDGHLWCNGEWFRTWDEVELTELAAFDKYVEKETERVNREINILHNLKSQRDNYRDPAVVKAEKLAYKAQQDEVNYRWNWIINNE